MIDREDLTVGLYCHIRLTSIHAVAILEDQGRALAKSIAKVSTKRAGVSFPGLAFLCLLVHPGGS